MDRADIGDRLVARVQGADDFPGDDAGGDATDGLARGGAAPAFPVPDAILGLVGEIGMRGTEHGLHLGVGRGAGILVVDGDQDGGAKCLAVEDAGEDAAFVLLLTGGDDVALARTATIQFNLDLLGSDRETGRAAVDDATNPSAVGFPPGGDAEQSAENTGHKSLHYGVAFPVIHAKSPALPEQGVPPLFFCREGGLDWAPVTSYCMGCSLRLHPRPAAPLKHRPSPGRKGA